MSTRQLSCIAPFHPNLRFSIRLDPGDFDKTSTRANNFYHKWGITGSDKADNVEFLSFQETTKRLGHVNRTIDVFKIDCEGCEWDSYKDWITADIRQIQVETHMVKGAKTLAFFDELQRHNFVMFHKEPNIHPGAGVSNIVDSEWTILALCLRISHY